MSLTDTIEVPRRTMVLFFIVDVSGSMDGSKINAVNEAIMEVIPAIQEISDGNADAQIKIAALEFSSGAQWITSNGPVEAGQFRWNYLSAAGTTDLGAACEALNKKLSTKAFMQEAIGSFAPAIFLLSDGDPTDDWQRYLAELKQNNWFKTAVKVAVAIGDDANLDVLKEFTGSVESVLTVHDAPTLKKMIKFIAVTSSKVASKSANAGDNDDEQKQKAVEEALQDEVASNPTPTTEIW